ncbi:hypothetical protein DSI28_12460, partial [Mycobacterium tuberculosis]
LEDSCDSIVKMLDFSQTFHVDLREVPLQISEVVGPQSTTSGYIQLKSLKPSCQYCSPGKKDLLSLSEVQDFSINNRLKAYSIAC